MPAEDVLARVPLLAGLSKRQLKSLAKAMTNETIEEGSQVTVEGADGNSFFVVVKGEAEVTVGDRTRGTISDGDHFGEIALIDGGGRSATITTTSDKLFSFGMDSETFREFVARNPDIGWALMRSLCERIRAAESDSD
ncbi:MAG: cyclic nucleotide-binding domain-containing protein [Thermoleophilaceae bacterium]|nr:cyclic nucleotide-binding domain-containing protein [Thermoleophilaceae bacterium]